MKLTAAIGRIAERTQQEWNVIVLFNTLDDKPNRHHRKETLDAAHSKIRTCIERQSVMARQERFGRRKEVLYPAVDVGYAFCDFLPTRSVGFSFQDDWDSGSGFSGRRIKNMGCDSAHFSKSFVNLISVIFRCSSAAICNSVAAEFLSLALHIASISSADFPVAQTININPNFSRYKRLASASPFLTVSDAAFISDCSADDHLADCRFCFGAACFEPIFG